MRNGAWAGWVGAWVAGLASGSPSGIATYFMLSHGDLRRAARWAQSASTESVRKLVPYPALK
jgi:hypothetical protein